MSSLEQSSSIPPVETRAGDHINHLTISPQLNLFYQKNLRQVIMKWEQNFLTESTFMTPDGKNYGKYNNAGKKEVDRNSDFWVQKGNEIIEQMYKSMRSEGIPEEKLQAITKIINHEIRGNTELDRFQKYARIESLVLAYSEYFSQERKMNQKRNEPKPRNPFAGLDL